MIPSGWDISELGSLAAFKSGGTPSKGAASFWGGGIPWITAKDLKVFYLQSSELTVTAEGATNGPRMVPQGALLILVRGMTLRKNVPVGITTRPMCFNQDVKALLPKNVSPEYLGYFLVGRKVQLLNLVNEAGHGTGRLQTNLLAAFPVLLPPQHERERIVEILKAWDRAIDLTEQLIAEKKERRKGLMQELLTGKMRLSGFHGDWEERPLQALTTECKARNKGKHGREDVRAVTKVAGMVPMKDHVMADNLDRYKIVAKHCFAYNPMRINVGSISMWRGDSDVVVSPDYVVFRCKEGKLDPEYFEFLRQTHRWRHYMDVAGSGGVRVRIYYDDLASFHFKFPPFAEQQAIARVLGAATREIDLLQATVDALREQKKGLMQQLLTGKKRVTV